MPGLMEVSDSYSSKNRSFVFCPQCVLENIFILWPNRSAYSINRILSDHVLERCHLFEIVRVHLLGMGSAAI